MSSFPIYIYIQQNYSQYSGIFSHNLITCVLLIFIQIVQIYAIARIPTVGTLAIAYIRTIGIIFLL